MKCNVGDLDRGVRFAAAGTAFGLGLFGRMSLAKRFLALALGGCNLITALSRHCPFNEMAGINTCHGEQATTGTLPGYIPADIPAEERSPASVI